MAHHSVRPPPPFLQEGLSLQIFKKGGLELLEEVAGKEGGDFFQGEGVAIFT